MINFLRTDTVPQSLKWDVKQLSTTCADERASSIGVLLREVVVAPGEIDELLVNHRLPIDQKVLERT